MIMIMFEEYPAPYKILPTIIVPSGSMTIYHLLFSRMEESGIIKSPGGAV